MKRDKQATVARHFKDPRSYVAPDSREVLYTKDWKARVAELKERSGGRCEQMVDGFDLHRTVGGWESRGTKDRCRSEAADPHHIIPRSKKRDDRLANLRALCRLHHNWLDPRKVRRTKRAKDAVG